MERPMDGDKDELELEEKHVADEIEAAIPQPASIEAEAMLEAAELEELKFKQDPG
ncbi:MAG: hypothetical protein HKN80_03090 [Acidimicrobiia bacterium]|nr:hypothetical protein [Acidimicrobiia bacterium]NNC91460.1 hypothetical protein [Acidimicrobiia bacterium]